MFVPVHDLNPLKRIPFQWMTVALIATNIIGYLVFGTGYFTPAEEYAIDFALVPFEFIQGMNLANFEVFRLVEPLELPEWMTLVSYMFVHVNILHLTGNMTFLWVFGDNIEDAMGRWRFLMFFVVCGVIAGVAHVAMLPDSQTPVIGASGGVAGIIGAYLVLHPRVRIWVLALYRVPLRINAGIAIAAWAAVQIYYGLFDETDTVAWRAHLAGFIAGMILVVFLRRPGVALFDKATSKA